MLLTESNLSIFVT